MTETLMLDCAWSKPTPAAAKVSHAGVLGYISRDPDKSGKGKDLSAAQAKAYVKAGLKVGLVFETTATEAEHNKATGVADRKYAELRAKALGYPRECVIFYAVDEDAAEAKIAAYFSGVFDGNTWPAGPYGSATVVKGVCTAHPRAIGWQTVAWSGDVVDSVASLYQRNHKTVAKVHGLAANAYDEDVVLKPLVLWGGTITPPHTKPEPKPAPSPKPHSATRFGPVTRAACRHIIKRAGTRHSELAKPDPALANLTIAALTHAVNVKEPK